MDSAPLQTSVKQKLLSRLIHQTSHWTFGGFSCFVLFCFKSPTCGSSGLSSKCSSGAASLFCRPGQASVVPEYRLKNATISSDGPHKHPKKENEREKKRAFGFTGSAILPGLCQRENTRLSWKIHLRMSLSPPNPESAPPPSKEKEKGRATGRNGSPALLTHLRNIKCTLCLPACALMNPRGAATCV